MARTDEQLKHALETELRWDPRVDAAQIGITVDKGAVALFGVVDTYAQKWAAERAVRRVDGVRAFAEELAVKPSTPHPRTDVEITTAIRSIFDWNASIPSTIQAKVEGGWVTLAGTARHDYERTEAQRVVGTLQGVVGVENAIELVPLPPADDLGKAVVAALGRRLAEGASHVEVETEGTRVTLRGRVASLRAVREAQAAAWTAPGVTHVEDRLELHTG